MILYYFFIVSLPFVDHPLFGASFEGLTVTKVLGLVCFAYGCLALLAAGRLPSFFATGQSRAFLVLTGLMLISQVTQGTPESWSQTMTFVYHVLFLITTQALVITETRLRNVLLAAMGGTGLAGLYLLKEWVTNIPVYGAGYRPGYVAGDPNFYTASALCFLPMAHYLTREHVTMLGRAFLVVCGVITFGAIIVCQSRGGFLGLLAAAFVVIWHSPRRVTTFAKIGLLTALFLLSPISPLERLVNPNYSDLESSDNRRRLWAAGLEMVVDHPLAGVGIGQFAAAMRERAGEGAQVAAHQVHNAYLEVAAELGLPGLLALVGTLVLTYFSLARQSREAPSDESSFIADTSLGLQAGLIGFSVSVFFISGLFLKMIWLVIFLSTCLPALASSEPVNTPGPRRTTL